MKVEEVEASQSSAEKKVGWGTFLWFICTQDAICLEGLNQFFCQYDMNYN